MKLDKPVATGLSTPTERQKLKKDLNQAYIDEELFWKHKSKNSWIKEGDRNTKFFSHCIQNQDEGIKYILSWVKMELYPKVIQIL